MTTSPLPSLSIVIPVYNEESNLESLFERLTQVLDQTGHPFEIIFVNDGSRDKTALFLEKFFEARPAQVRVIEFNGNYGQHMAIMAGFEKAEGDFVITMDADLQNPPEEIPKILEQIAKGHDYVGSYRLSRQDNWFRTHASRLANSMRGWATGFSIKDHGCMLRAYDRRIVKAVTTCSESSTLIPVLAYTFSANPSEVGIQHVARKGDDSKYTFYKLVRMYFDLFTGFSLLPLQLFTFLGLFVSGVSSLLVFYMIGRRLILGSEAEGVFTLFAILFFLVSVVITGIGIVGEYVGRIYQAVQNRPRYLIRRILKQEVTISPPKKKISAPPKAPLSKSPKEGTAPKTLERSSR
jgi:undecaprenyl-phosphate 4-deoxy-4-formamido-L-arabinose transferase